MTGGTPDRVPLMCQLSLGHIYLHAGIVPQDYWLTSKGLAEGYIRLADRYHFDGILLNVLGQNPDELAQLESVEEVPGGHIMTFKDGSRLFCPPDESPYPVDGAQKVNSRVISDIDIDQIPVIDSVDGIPAYTFDIIDYVIDRRADTLSIHGEIGTVFERFLLLMGSFADGLIALMDDPQKCKAIMDRMNVEVTENALAQCSRGIDAFKLSSPFAGAGFISREMYEDFVMPYEKHIIDEIHRRYGIPCYIHTCGAIGDRLDLMLETGTDGLECLDPPPLGTVDLKQAIDEFGDRIFIKGNLDSVNELLGNSPATVKEIARRRIEIGMKAKGYILSSACSVAPGVPPENIDALYHAVEEYGRYTACRD